MPIPLLSIPFFGEMVKIVQRFTKENGRNHPRVRTFTHIDATGQLLVQSDMQPNQIYQMK